MVGQAYPYIASSKSDYSSAQHYYGGSQPREIFEDLVLEEKQVLKKVKTIFRSLVKDHQIKFVDRTRESFLESLGGFAEFRALGQLEQQLAYEYYLQKLKDK